MQQRIITTRLCGVLCALAIAGSPLAAAAQIIDEPQVAAVVSFAPKAPKSQAQAKADSKADKKAQALLEKALKTLDSKGIVALKSQIPALAKALDAAPPDWSRLQVTISGGGDTPEAMAMNAYLQQAMNSRMPNTYPDIALLVGSYYVETHQMETAIAALDKGLAFDAGSPRLLGEKGVALSALGRYAEAVAVLDAGIAANQGSEQEMARLHRGRGVSLIDLNRLDDAEAALKTSLELQPNHPVALNELKYIEQLRAGAPAAGPAGFTTADKAAKLPLN